MKIQASMARFVRANIPWGNDGTELSSYVDVFLDSAQGCSNFDLVKESLRNEKREDLVKFDLHESLKKTERY